LFASKYILAVIRYSSSGKHGPGRREVAVVHYSSGRYDGLLKHPGPYPPRLFHNGIQPIQDSDGLADVPQVNDLGHLNADIKKLQDAEGAEYVALPNIYRILARLLVHNEGFPKGLVLFHVFASPVDVRRCI